MRFRTDQSRPPFLNRKDQVRLLGLVASLTLVLIAMKVTADPAMWAWMFPPQERADQADSELIAAPLNIVPGVDDTSLIPSATLQSESSSNALRGTVAADLQLDPQLLSSIRDDYSGIRRSEADAYHQVLSHVSGISAQQLEETGRTDVGYTQLMAEADRYRGLLVTVEGEIRRLQPLATDPGDASSGQLYEAWLFTRESGVNPYRVVATDVSPGMPQGENVKTPSRVTGYFFKRQGYKAQGGLRIAPLVLAKTIQPLKPVASQPIRRGAGLAPYVAGFAVLTAIVLAITLWRYQQSDRMFRREHKHRLSEASPEAIESLKEIETVDPTESLQRLADEVKRA